MSYGREVLINAEGLVLGRLASIVAKLLIYGYRVYIVNAERAVVSGDPQMVKESYALWFEIKTLRNPEKWSPHRPRNPVSIVKYAVRGMLPKHPFKKILLLKRLKVYVGYPDELKKAKLRTIDVSAICSRKLGHKYVTLGEVAKYLGWRGEL
ncbi:MAG: 50S ribosomal protein L13 [Sulfolobales archaeon]|nr:50S ribosomal protein L13 [Sulfolobales archaeon]MCX8208832.1 50S ribosomal protein L13 [Sulfolobales archaeon]MDW8010143.1 50S ribosomal protein L13 [Sulfolobales archaeon]